MFTVAKGRKSVNPRLTANSCSVLAAPLITALKIKKPRFHVQHRVGPLNEQPSFGETTVISGKPHIFISDRKNELYSELLATIAHELIHAWQFTTQHNCQGEVFNPEDCEIQAYALEPLATVALAASWLSEELITAKQKEVA